MASINGKAAGETQMLEGLLGLVILALDIWAIIKIIGSPASTGAKVLWILLIILLPVVGLLIWLLAGPKGPGPAPA
jgi:hypothetical protein